MAQPSPDASTASLLSRVMSHPLDRPGDRVPFTSKLARQNGWTLAYARRVVLEYRRFAFLSVAADHVVTPSDTIDQAWHLHLTYTRDYWETFCPLVLGRPLHHEPGDGSTRDDARHAEQYAQTLTSYRQHFGEDAPVDIWPRTDQQADFVRLDRKRFWLLPRWHPFAAHARPLFAALLGTVGLSGCSWVDDSGGWNVLDYSGPHFLAFYVVALICYGIMILVMPLVRNLLDDSDGWRTIPKLTPEEAAYLAGGPPRTVGVAMLELAQQDKLLLDGGLNILHAAPHTPDMPPLQRAILHSASLRTRFIGIGNRMFRQDTDEIAAGLAERGLLAPMWLAQMQNYLLTAMAGALLLLGSAKVVIGLGRGRPVFFLVIILFLFASACWQRWRMVDRSPPLTALGRQTVEALGKARSYVDQDDLSLRYRYALLGPAALIGTQMAALRFALTPQPLIEIGKGNGGGDCSSCSSGSGGGSGCGGGGGCGGCGGGGD